MLIVLFLQICQNLEFALAIYYYFIDTQSTFPIIDGDFDTMLTLMCMQPRRRYAVLVFQFSNFKVIPIVLFGEGEEHPQS